MLNNIRVITCAVEESTSICKVSVYFLLFIMIYNFFDVFPYIMHARACRIHNGMPSHEVLNTAGNPSWRKACSVLR